MQTANHSSKGTYSLLTKITAHWGKENTCWGPLDTGSELTPTAGNPKHQCGPPVRVGTYGGQVISGVLAQAHVTMDPVGPRTTLWLNTSSGMHNSNTYTQQLAESPYGFPDLWSEGYYGGKGQMEVTRTASTYKNTIKTSVTFLDCSH